MDPTEDTVAVERSAGRAERLAAGLRMPEKVGRYAIVGSLGAGGMGTVLDGRDPELGRRVAIKILHAGAERERLLAEARKLAAINHPNVVPVFEVGLFEDRPFFAMQRVEGRSLGAWLKDGPRPWAETIDVLVQAGRGLAAAHAAGLVHRDFKPANVVVGDDGRVRVVDFGLAGAFTDDPTDPGTTSSGGSRSFDSGVAGTPSYMAPEQFSAMAVTPAADQYSFCATAYRALVGNPPFRGRTFRDLRAKVVAEPVPEIPRAVAPAWVRRAITRGLAKDPAARWPSMDALLQELTRGPSRRFRLVPVAVVAVGLVAAAWAWTPRAPTCVPDELLADAWGDPEREALRESLGESAWLQVEPSADAYVEALRTAAGEACAEPPGTPAAAAQLRCLRGAGRTDSRR